jgi:hypothetical protein
VRVSGDDYDRLGDRAEEVTHFVGNRAFLRMTEGHCVALRIEADAGRFVCTIYDARPTTCRELDRGSSECQGELATKRVRPRRALAQLRA